MDYLWFWEQEDAEFKIRQGVFENTESTGVLLDF
jgi:hypothetical protein